MLQTFETTKMCVISCKKVFKTDQDCYRHMYLSMSEGCQRLHSKLEKCGFEEEIDSAGIQKTVLNVKALITQQLIKEHS